MKYQGRGSLGENWFLFRVVSAIQPEVAFEEKGFSARHEMLFAPAGISFLNFLQPGRVRNFWWGAWNGLGDGRQEILFLPPVLCRPRRMFRMGSKDTLLEPCVIWVPAGCLEGHQEQGEGCKMLRIQEHGQRLQRVGTSGWVRNRKTGDAGL